MTRQKIKPGLHRQASNLRHSQTDPESKLWTYLRSHRLQGLHFRRQHPIGEYIVDFCAPKQKLIIELDGSQHLDQIVKDAERTADLQSKGYKVLRFWNNDVMNDLNAVIIAIQHEISKNES